MKSKVSAYDGGLDAYLGWLWWCAWNAARGDCAEADRLWQAWRRLHGA